MGIIKFNVDAIVSRGEDHETISAIGGDEKGKFIGASLRMIKGISDPATLEAMVCSEALIHAQDQG
jgi:hypothetical protein